MSRAALALGVAALALAVALGVFAGVRVMPSYLAAWLFFVSVPLGALPLVMGCDLAGAGLSPLADALRRLLAMLPVAAMLGVPVLFGVHGLYGWARAPLPGFAGGWYTPGFFTARAVVFLILWMLLAFVFARPPARGDMGRRGIAVAGLALHLVMGTLAASDWAMSLEPGLGSSSFGLLMIAAQCGIAVSAAVLTQPRLPVAQAGGLLLALLGAWAFLQFTQFLIVWSADLPREIVWYTRRDAGWGRAAEWLAAALLLTPLAVAMADRMTWLAGVAAIVLLLHLIGMLWLVTPALRGRFVVTPADALALIGVGGTTIGLGLMLAGRGAAHADG